MSINNLCLLTDLENFPIFFSARSSINLCNTYITSTICFFTLIAYLLYESNSPSPPYCRDDFLSIDFPPLPPLCASFISVCKNSSNSASSLSSPCAVAFTDCSSATDDAADVSSSCPDPSSPNDDADDAACGTCSSRGIV